MAQYILGNMYADGIGDSKGHTKALKWCQLSTMQDYISLILELWSIYGEGEGVDRNYTEALKWYWLAAVPTGFEKELAKAQKILGWISGLKLAEEWRDHTVLPISKHGISKAKAIAQECMSGSYQKYEN